MSCTCGGRRWVVGGERHGSSFGFSLDPCECNPHADAADDMVGRVYGVMIGELQALAGGPSMDAALGRAYSENALLRAEIADLRRKAS